MGKAIPHTKVKVDGQAGPLGKGVPLSQAVGQGGLAGVATGSPADQNTQVPGVKPMLESAEGKNAWAPGQHLQQAMDKKRDEAFKKISRMRMFPKLGMDQEKFNTAWDKGMNKRMSKFNKFRGGIFGKLFKSQMDKVPKPIGSHLQPVSQQLEPAQPIGGLQEKSFKP